MNILFNQTYIGFLLNGALWTILLSALAFFFGGFVGGAIALMRISPARWVRSTATLYIQLIQGTPLMVILFLIYFGLPAMGVNVSPLIAATVSMTIYASAYLGEIWRGSIQSVPKEQWEAAECLALTRTQRMTQVILPQAVRIATPPTVGFLVQIVKNTSLVSVVGFVELARSAQLINNSTFQPFAVYMIVAVIYFAICFPLSMLSRKLEARTGYAGKKQGLTP